MSPILVLVTGASGFVGSEIALEFLRQGFAVRLSIRKQEQASLWDAKYPEYKYRVDFVLVKAMGTPGAFDDAVRGVTYIAHAASPMVSAGVKDNKKEVLDPAIAGVVGLLESAHKEPSVKAIAITSSIVTHLDLVSALPGPGDVIKADAWNPITYEVAASLPTEYGVLVYAASKTLAERAAFDFVKEKNPTFNLTTYTITFAPF